MRLSGAACGRDDFDRSYPYPDGSIGAWGYDPRGGGRLVPPSTTDFTSHCEPPFWVSDYHFTNALRFRASQFDDPPAAGADRVPQTRTILVSGGADADGVPLLEPAFVVDAPASLPEVAGDYRITELAGGGAELFSLSFAMPEAADDDGDSTFAVPAQSSWAGTLDRITLSGPGGSVTLDADSDRAAAVLRNPRTGQVRGILRGALDLNELQAYGRPCPVSARTSKSSSAGGDTGCRGVAAVTIF